MEKLEERAKARPQIVITEPWFTVHVLEFPLEEGPTNYW